MRGYFGPYGGAFAVTRGFWDEYGSRRIKDSPLSESVIVGAGVGAAIAGLRPIVELMTIDFSRLAIDQIVNHSANIQDMLADQFSVPLMIRTVIGPVPRWRRPTPSPWRASMRRCLLCT